MQAIFAGRKGLGCPSDGKQDKEDTSSGRQEVMEAQEKDLAIQENGVELNEKGVELREKGVELKEKEAELQEKEVESTAKEKEQNPLEERSEPCKEDKKSPEEGIEAEEKGTELLVKGVESRKKGEESRRAERPRNGEASSESRLQVPESEGVSLSREIKRGDGDLMSEGGEVDRYYVLGQQINIEEDLCHEFKGHRSISIHDLHNLCLNTDGTTDRSRNAVSIPVCAMLNSSHGGTIYLGVADDGQVKGMGLTRYQRDHVEASLKWTLSKYTPPVSESRYCVKFVPVASSKNTQKSFKFQEEIVDEERRGQPHHVAQPNYCWCDMDASALRALGRLPMLFVVEVHIRPWDPHCHASSVEKNPLYGDAPPLPPLHLTEAGGMYVRQSCRQSRLCLEDVRRLEVHRVKEHYALKAMALEERYLALRDLALQHGVEVPT
ncbi:uncharacterized protein LOC134782626 [Penaeus indicus]|uniref:uncharacterized protein LOC134782626 n=1 Tax=Penaeus indicus TaxID=29960 RepID=UPI00300D06E5